MRKPSSCPEAWPSRRIMPIMACAR